MPNAARPARQAAAPSEAVELPSYPCDRDDDGACHACGAWSYEPCAQDQRDARDAYDAAMAVARPYRRFRVECECDGAPFVWEGLAVNEAAAIRCAAHDLAVKVPTVSADSVRATVCIEVAA